LFLLTEKEGNIVTAILTDVKTSQPALTEGGKNSPVDGILRLNRVLNILNDGFVKTNLNQRRHLHWRNHFARLHNRTQYAEVREAQEHSEKK